VALRVHTERNPSLPQHQDTISHTVNLKSYAPKDGQKIARDMLSRSWRSINCYCCI